MLPQRNQETVMPGRLRPLSPFDRLSAEQLIVAAGRTTLKRFRDGDYVLTRGSDDDSDYFLIAGKVVLLDAEGNSKFIISGSTDASNALAATRPCLYHVRALGPVVCARMARAEVAILREHATRVPHMRSEEVSGDSADARGLFDDLEADIVADRLKLPSLPDLAMRIRAAVSKPACDNRRVAELLAADPAAAAKILKIANSPLWRGSAPVTRLRDAVNRIGLYTVSELVVCFSLKDLFEASSPSLRERFAEVVGESVHIGAAASVIAERVAAGSAEQALVAGLLSNIGAFPLLERLATQAELLREAGWVERALAAYAPRIGRLICRNWNLGEAVGAAVTHGADWSFVAEGAVTLAEIVICARYHTVLAVGQAQQLPKPDQIKAMRILGQGLTPQLSLAIIRDAKLRVDALLDTLS